MGRLASALAVLALLPAARAEFRLVEFTLGSVDCAQCFESLPSRMKRTRGVESVDLNAPKAMVTVRLAAGNRTRIELLADAIKQDGTKIKLIRVEATGAILRDGDKLTFTPSGLSQSYAIEGAKPAESAAVEGVIREPGAAPWTIHASLVR